MMKQRWTWMAAAALVPAAANAVVLNELRINAPGGETPSEFIELLGTPGESLDGLTFVGIGDDGANVGVIENVVDLTGLSIPSDGLFTIANASFGDASALGFDASVIDALILNEQLENNDVVSYLLVTGFSGTLLDDLDTNDDGTLDTLAWATIIDGVGTLDDTPGDPDYTGQLGIPVIGPDGSFTPAHLYRLPGGGDWQIGPFGSADAVDTPGATNVPEPATAALLGLCAAAMLRRRGA